MCDIVDADTSVYGHERGGGVAVGLGGHGLEPVFKNTLDMLPAYWEGSYTMMLICNVTSDYLNSSINNCRW